MHLPVSLTRVMGVQDVCMGGNLEIIVSSVPLHILELLIPYLVTNRGLFCIELLI